MITNSSNDSWEAAYLRFETPEQEISKFVARLKGLGAASWPQDARILELFCGRGNGLLALQRMGFARVSGPGDHVLGPSSARTIAASTIGLTFTSPFTTSRKKSHWISYSRTRTS